MLKAQIVFASRTGNNEEIANILHDCLARKKLKVSERAISESKFADFVNGDILIVCSYSYGKGQLPQEMRGFYGALQNTDLSGKVFGLAGSGDRTFGPFFNRALYLFTEAFKKAGAVQGASKVKIDLEPTEEDIERLNQFSEKLVRTANRLKGRK